MNYISMFNGVGLNIEEKLKLEIYMNDLHKETGAEEALFWGKIIGTQFDYFITLLVNYKGYYEFPKKVFYYASSSNFLFKELPDIKKYHIEDNEANHFEPFFGDPTKILKQYVNPDEVKDPELEKKEKPVNPDPLDISDSEDNKVVVEEKKRKFY